MFAFVLCVREDQGLSHLVGQVGASAHFVYLSMYTGVQIGMYVCRIYVIGRW